MNPIILQVACWRKCGEVINEWDWTKYVIKYSSMNLCTQYQLLTQHVCLEHCISKSFIHFKMEHELMSHDNNVRQVYMNALSWITPFILAEVSEFLWYRHLNYWHDIHINNFMLLLPELKRTYVMQRKSIFSAAINGQ